MDKFESIIEVRWSDVDQNRHVRHSAYYDYAAHVRIRLFEKIGYSAKQFEALNIGPVLFHEECSFIKEINLNDTIRINVLQGEIAPDGTRWSLHHEIFNKKNEKVAQITVKGAWIDLAKRKLTIPPQDLMQVLLHLPKGEKFAYGK